MNQIWAIILSFIFSFIISWCIIPRVILISFKKKWFDSSEGRKVHKGNIPRLGGVAFTPAVIISTALVFILSLLLDFTINGMANHVIQLCYVFAATILLYFSGITDDIAILGYKRKFLSQFISAALIVAAGVWVNNFFGFAGWEEVPWQIGYPFTILFIVYIINSMNLIDGIDGLASGLTMIAMLFLGSLFIIQGNTFYAVVAFSLLGALVPFFYYNVFGSAEQKSKIFMGDCGSMVLGLLIAFLSIRLGMFEKVSPFNNSESIAVAFSILVIPCFDSVRVMIGRIVRRKNPFLPDKTHLHHLFLDIGMSQTTTLVIILMLDICFIVMNLVLAGNLDINVILLINIVFYALIPSWLCFLLKKKGVRRNNQIII